MSQTPQVTTLDVVTGPNARGETGTVRISRGPDGLLVSVDGGDPTPLVGGGPGSVPLAEFYVSPDGMDENTGLLGSPKRTIYAGLEALIDAGGGFLYCDSGCDVGGPVPDQGIWLRLDNGVDFFPEGFLPANVPIFIVGTGNDAGIGPFTNSPVTNFIGGGGRFKPPLWILGMGQQSPVTITGMQCLSDSHCGAKIAVDYDRETDGSLKQIVITNATRTGTSTTFEVTLPSGLAVTLASRTSNVTTLTIPNPGIPYQPWRIGQHVKVTSGDVNFSSGDKVITTCSNLNNENDNTLWTISYAETAANVPEGPITGTSVQSHNCSDAELLDLVTDNVHFIGTQYFVTSHTAETITVLDNQGDGDADEDDIGTLVHQERHYGHTKSLKFFNTSFNISSSLPPGFYPRHGWDLGSNLADPMILDGCWLQGNVDDNYPVIEDRTSAALYAYGGRFGGCAVELRDCNGAGNKIYIEAGDGQVYFKNFGGILEAPNSEWEDPGILVHGNSFARVYVADFTFADGATNAAWVEHTGCQYAGIEVYRSGPVRGTCVGGDQWQTPNGWNAGTNRKNPWVGFDESGMQVQVWAKDGRITGKHPAAVRAMGPTFARFKNVIAAAEDWVPDAHAVVTPGAGVTAPDGGPSDLITTDGTANVIVKPSAGDGVTWEAGGRVVFCGWINSPGQFNLLDTFAAFQSASFATMGISTGYTGTGWQFVSGHAVVEATSSSSPTYTIYIALAGAAEFSVWGLTAHYFPADIDVNDFAEYAGTLKHQARYLLPGLTGTMDGQKYIADGGLGTNARYTVGVAPGEITLGSANGEAIEIFDREGNSLGVLPLFDFTVNPP